MCLRCKCHKINYHIFPERADYFLLQIYDSKLTQYNYYHNHILLLFCFLLQLAVYFHHRLHTYLSTIAITQHKHSHFKTFLLMGPFI